jgi:hypothetical protein
MAMASHRYTVRRMNSGYTASVKWYVYDTHAKSRVTVNAHHSREGAQREADALNVTEDVADYVDDPRPYSERLAEAQKRFGATG